VNAFVTLTCAGCDARFDRRAAEVKYRRKAGIRRTFCSQACVGAEKHRRLGKSLTQKKRDKSLYDRLYRARNREALRRKKAAYFQCTYDPEEARLARRKNAARHAEYIRRYYADPSNKAAKVAYDKARRAAEYGDFADAYGLLLELQREVIQRCPDKYERLKARGYYERINTTKRQRRAECRS